MQRPHMPHRGLRPTMPRCGHSIRAAHAALGACKTCRSGRVEVEGQCLTDNSFGRFAVLLGALVDGVQEVGWNEL